MTYDFGQVLVPYLRLASGATVLTLLGCTAWMTVVPEVPKGPHQVEVLLRGKLFYDGKPDYLPRTVAAGGGPESTLAIRYSYEDTQGRKNPGLSFTRQGGVIGITDPVGSKGMRVVGNLDILDGDSVIKTYSAMATLTISSDWSRETLSDMRRRGLLAVRDNVEAQMYQDREFFQKLASGRVQPSSQ